MAKCLEANSTPYLKTLSSYERGQRWNMCQQVAKFLYRSEASYYQLRQYEEFFSSGEFIVRRLPTIHLD